MTVRQGLANFLSLFTSTGTLVCCALPSLLVAVGAGMAMATLIETMFWLVALSRYKEWMFLGAGLMIGFNFVFVYWPRSKVACTIGGGRACGQAGRVNKVILWMSAGIYLTGLFAAYLLLPLQQMLAGA